MARFLCVASLTLASFACALPAQAEWLGEFFHSVGRDFKRRNCWPEPFVYPDRLSVRAPFVVMVENGWRSQNTIGDQHFDGTNGQLTEAGRLKIRWILNDAPPQHRTIYVYRSMSPEETTARIDSVQQFAAELAPQGELPQVVETNIAEQGWPASRVDNIGRMFQSSAPKPRLPAVTAATGNTGN